MKRCALPLLLFAISLCGCASSASLMHLALSRTNQSEDLVHAAALTRRLAEDLLVTANLPGLSVAISKDGELVFADGFGFADVEAGRKVTPHTQFRAASVSKMITVTALAKLLQSGKLTLDSPIHEYALAYPKKQWTITVRQLAAHLGGLPHYSDQDRIERRFYSSVDDALSVFGHIPLQSQPGSQYHYSTHGYTLLSAAIEGAAGRPFLEYLKDEILVPLAMRSTGPDLRSRPGQHAASLYVLQDGVRTKVMNPEDPSYKWAGGGMLSTPTDLVLMGNAYFNGFLTANIVRSIFERQRLAGGEEMAIGIGWRQSFDMDGRLVMEHAGGMEGARSVLALFPNQGLAIAVMVNASWPGSIEETAHMLALPFLAPAASAPSIRGEYDVEITLQEDSKNPEIIRGQLQLSGRNGSLTHSDGGAAIRLPALQLNRGNIYALVRPDGLFHLTIGNTPEGIRGRAVKYWSMLKAAPADLRPFMSFVSTNPPRE
jgi:serine beta-lactamase-like protein LACTB